MIANAKLGTAGYTSNPRGSVRIRTIALPAEHGGWGFLLEPVVLALVLAPSIAGFYLAFSAVAFFLARQPLMLVVMNRRRPSPRTGLAKRFAAIYVITGSVCLIAAMAFTQHRFFVPLLIALPLASVQLAYDWTGRRRVLSAEIAAAIAVSSLAASILLAGGQPSAPAYAVWVVMIGRAVPSILYVRSCLARRHRRPASIFPILISQVVALLVVWLLAGAGLIPRLGVVVMIVLLVRAATGFTRCEKLTPKQLGLSEIFFGAITVLALALGTIFGF